ncbi:hypothetical protein MNV49_000109 [Pseudohyphozyma bogoriensis]|nr:hypothetical protein MNV49_000109 [Pseudohyphozyma bogoriensis]
MAARARPAQLELFKFSLYVFFPIAIMLHYGDPDWYDRHVGPIRDHFIKADKPQFLRCDKAGNLVRVHHFTRFWIAIRSLEHRHSGWDSSSSSKKGKGHEDIRSHAPTIPQTRLKRLELVRWCGPGAVSVEWFSRGAATCAIDRDGMVEILVQESDEDDNRPTYISLTIPFSAVSRVSSVSANPAVFLDLDHPFFMRRVIVHHDGTQKLLERPLYIDVLHNEVAKFVGRSVCLEFPSISEQSNFVNLTTTAGCPIVLLDAVTTLSGSRYAPADLKTLREWTSTLDVPPAFQLDGLLYNGILDAPQLLSIRPAVTDLLENYSSSQVEKILVAFVTRLLDPRVNRTASPEGPDDALVVGLDGEIIIKDLEGALGELDHGHHFSEGELVEKLEAAQEVLSFVNLQPEHEARTITVTPSRFIFSGPNVEDSNAVIRQYGQPEYFLRLVFRDEHGDSVRARPREDAQTEKFVDRRFGYFLRYGMEVCGRDFEFLAYSSTALKYQTVFFVAPFVHGEDLVTAETIRQALGDFTKVINIPAKWMARMAQLFGSTRPSITLTADEIVEIPDIESAGPPVSCHTDGVGLISPLLADDINEKLSEGLTPAQIAKRVPGTCFQIRLGGIKGMVSVDPSLEGRVLQARPSMIKFLSESRTLDIAGSFERPLRAYLNRPLIKILEDLKVSHQTLLDLQKQMLQDIAGCKHSWFLTSLFLDDFGLAQSARLSSTLSLLSPVLPRADLNSPFLEEALSLAASHTKRELKWKSRIHVPESWNLVGVADPSGYLSEGEIFACIHEPGKPPEYLEGLVAISRSPTMAEGDVQVVRAVGELPEEFAPRIRGLVNCVVFSTQGKRSLPSCLAGGDLDGDLYLVITNPDLIPKKCYPAASYDAPDPRTVNYPCTIADGINFFLEYMLNDRTGQVATRHLHIAELEFDGVFHRDCRKLVQLHSDAVDYAKTGVPVPFQAIPRANGGYPDFMSDPKLGKRSIETDGILGKLFRAVDECIEGGPRSLLSVHKRRQKQANKTLDPKRKLSTALASLVDPPLPQVPPQALVSQLSHLLPAFSEEMVRIARHATVTDEPTEAELLIGVQAGSGKEQRSVKNVVHRMTEQTSALFSSLRKELQGGQGQSVRRGWAAWCLAVEEDATSRDPRFGVRTFGLIALNVLLEGLEIEEKH